MLFSVSKRSASLLVILFSVFLLCANQAYAAKRFGGGQSSGMQRSQMSQPRQTQNQQRTSQQNPQQKKSWMGPLAGLAAGLGLAALASHFGFGEELASMMMALLIGIALIAVLGFVFRKKLAGKMQTMQPAYAAAGAEGHSQRRAVHFDTAARDNHFVETPSARTSFGQAALAASTSNIGANTIAKDAESIFRRLQLSHANNDSAQIQQLTTADYFAEIAHQYQGQPHAAHTIEISSLNSSVLKIEDLADSQQISVHFSGQISEDGCLPLEFDEIWHFSMVKDAPHSMRIAGIQQTATA